MSSRSRFLFIFIVTLTLQSRAISQQATVISRQPMGTAHLDVSDTSIERWDKLSLEDNNLRPDPPIAGQTDTFPEFTRELLRVKWRGGDPIDLYIVRPAGVANPPVILYLYGYPAEAVRLLDHDFCKTLTKQGFAAIGFSPMLTGQRYHDVSMKEWFVSDLQRSLVGTTHDLQMVLNYLTTRGDLDVSRVGIFGEGSGATVAVLAASVDKRIQAIDLLNPWGDWPDWLAASRIVPDSERADYMKPDFLQSIAPLDPVFVLPKLDRTAVRLQQTLWDSSKTPATSRDRIAASLPPSDVVARYKDQQDYLEKVGNSGKMLDWMYNSLAARRESQSGN
jgi:acetyl esterase/lipase